MPTHLLINYLMTNDVYINEDIQHRQVYPFTMGAAQQFFSPVASQTFDFPVAIGAIVIYDGKYNPPSGSYVAGFLFRQDLDALFKLGQMPQPAGSIHIEYRGQGDNVRIKTTRLSG